MSGQPVEPIDTLLKQVSLPILTALRHGHAFPLPFEPTPLSSAGVLAVLEPTPRDHFYLRSDILARMMGLRDLVDSTLLPVRRPLPTPPHTGLAAELVALAERRAEPWFQPLGMLAELVSTAFSMLLGGLFLLPLPNDTGRVLVVMIHRINGFPAGLDLENEVPSFATVWLYRGRLRAIHVVAARLSDDTEGGTRVPPWNPSRDSPGTGLEWVTAAWVSGRAYAQLPRVAHSYYQHTDEAGEEEQEEGI